MSAASNHPITLVQRLGDDRRLIGRVGHGLEELLDGARVLLIQFGLLLDAVRDLLTVAIAAGPRASRQLARQRRLLFQQPQTRP